MNDVARFHTLRWIRINSGFISGCEIEEFIDTTRNYHKTVWSDGYTEIVPIHVRCSGQNIQQKNEIFFKTLCTKSVYKSPKTCYNIYVNKTKDGTYK